MKRNHDKHTSRVQAEWNVLQAMSRAKANSWSNDMHKSAMGYAAFPDYNFRWPQGAAFAVAKIARDLHNAKLISHGKYGFYITPQGEQALANHE